MEKEHFCAKTIPCVVSRVKSADDLVALVATDEPKWFMQVRIRLAGVDAPSAFNADVGGVAIALRDEVRALVGANECRVLVEKKGGGNSGWLVKLYSSQDGQSFLCINDLLISRGYTYKFNKGKP